MPDGAAPRIYLCYQYREKPLAEALAASLAATNPLLDDYDQRMRVQVESEAASASKRDLRDALTAAAAVVVLVGPTTATSSWVNWELACALELGKPLVAIRADRDDVLPSAMEGADVTYAEAGEIEKAVAQATGHGASRPG
jgi:hypothetical protein